MSFAVYYFVILINILKRSILHKAEQPLKTWIHDTDLKTFSEWFLLHSVISKTCSNTCPHLPAPYLQKSFLFWWPVQLLPASSPSLQASCMVMRRSSWKQLHSNKANMRTETSPLGSTCNRNIAGKLLNRIQIRIVFVWDICVHRGSYM